jgi:hypothetical protein
MTLFGLDFWQAASSGAESLDGAQQAASAAANEVLALGDEPAKRSRRRRRIQSWRISLSFWSW